MGTQENTGFEPATGDGPPADGPAAARAASVRTAFEGLLQIRRLTVTGGHAPEAVPAPWERNRPVRAVALALESSGATPSAVDPSGNRVATGYRVTGGPSGSVRVEWAGPPGSGAAYDEEEALAGCGAALRRLGWTVLPYRGPRGRRFLEVEPPGGLSGGDGRA